MESTILIGAWVVIGGPFLLVAVLGISALAGRQPAERWVGRLCGGALAASLIAALVVAGIQGCARPGDRYLLTVGHWVVTPDYHLTFRLIFDSLSIPFVVLGLVLCSTIAAFAVRYLHRDQGFHRFFVLFAVFALGFVLAALAGTIETLFVGWELVGLASVMLVAYFQERPAPPSQGFRIWVVYRVTDAALLLAAIVLHHLHGEGDFSAWVDGAQWPAGSIEGIGAVGLSMVGGLLVIAAAGKSALLPFSGWLPRAMEGPTPSSAIFYGALSVHLGAFLLLRMGPLLDQTPVLSGALVFLGLATAVYALLAGSVQSDIKSSLAFASLVQVGLIVAEIGWGWRVIPLVHLIGNASLRTLQFVRAPTLLHDYHLVESALGKHLPPPARGASRWRGRIRDALYYLAWKRDFFDEWLIAWCVRPLVTSAEWMSRWEERWRRWLSAGRYPGRSGGGVTRQEDRS